MNETARQLLKFIKNSPSGFHAVENCAAALRADGYTALEEGERWRLTPGGKYFVTRSGSSLLCFRIPSSAPTGFVLAAAHSDSPTFRLKQNAQSVSAGCVRLNTEKYGGMLMSTWFDRPLSLAGRVLVRQDGVLTAKTVQIDRDLLVIPSVAIHMNRSANDGVRLLANVDTLPLFGGADSMGALEQMLARCAGVQPEQIVSHELSLYVRGEGTLVGANEEFISAPKLDDLECAFTALHGFLQAKPTSMIPVCCVFDNEEVGSETKQGAASNLLRDTLRRIALCLGLDEEDHLRLLANSFMASCDNAHAQHPNHPEYSDGENCPFMNGGVVVKYNAAQRYSTDALSAAVFETVCKNAGVKTQTFANRSDLPGGSTLGSISNTRVAVPTVDIGLAQLAMHSCWETAGTFDAEAMLIAMRALFSSEFVFSGGSVTVKTV